MAEKRTPTPRKLRLPLQRASTQIMDKDCGLVANAFYDEFAEEIVRVCNSHDALVAAASQAEAIFARQKWRADGPDPEAVALRELRAALKAARSES